MFMSKSRKKKHPGEVCSIRATMESRHQDIAVRRRYIRRVCHKEGSVSLLGRCEEAAVVHLHSIKGATLHTDIAESTKH